MFLVFFLKPVFCTTVAEKFQIHGVKITGKCFCESKNWICSFLPMSPSKTLPQVFAHVPKQNTPPLPQGRKLPIPPPKQRFLYFSSAEREDYGAEKMNMQWYWSQVLINSTIFATTAFLVSVMLCHNLDWSMLKCEGSLT